MEKETIPKFATIMVCVIVAVTIIMTALVPIISDTIGTETELTPAEGAYGPAIEYKPGSDFVGTHSYIFEIEYGTGFDSDFNDVDMLGITNTFYMNSSTWAIRSDLPDEFIVYADDNATVYIDGFDVHFVGVLNNAVITLSNTVKKIDIRYDVYGYGDGNNILYAYPVVNDDPVVDFKPAPTYCYMVTGLESSIPGYNVGDYANFVGDNPPSMDTPAVTAGGMYIGPKMTETTVSKDPFTGSVVLTIIPIIMLVSLVMLCIREFMKKQE